MSISLLHVLDTNTATYILSGRSPAARTKMMQMQQNGRIAISTITEAEILFGLEKKASGLKLRSAIEGFLAHVEKLSWDSSAALAYAKLRTRLNVSGKSLGALDMLIAAHAVSVGAVLVTHDRAFLHASALMEVTDWATDLSV